MEEGQGHLVLVVGPLAPGWVSQVERARVVQDRRLAGESERGRGGAILGVSKIPSFSLQPDVTSL